MPNKNYKYPRVTISTKALNHSVSVPEAVDTTILFAPICSPKGPTDKLVKLHTISELEDIFGRLDYVACGQTALNVYQWLSAGGTVYVKRLNNGATAKYAPTNSAVTVEEGGATPSTPTTIAEAVYCGVWYDGLKLEGVKNSTTGRYNIAIKDTNDGNKELFRAYSVEAERIKETVNKSGLIILTNEFLPSHIENKSISISGGSDFAEDNTYYTCLESYLTKYTGSTPEGIYGDLGNRLETPVDIILDAGYSVDIKKLLLTFLTGVEYNSSGGSIEPDDVDGDRADIIGIFDTCDLSSGDIDETTFEGIHARNIAVYAQKFVISDEILSDRDIEVSPTYFLARLLPYNDNLYGIQFPTAGLRRGVLEDVLKVNENPLPSKKNYWFEERINYVEKTSREYAFMSQRTHDGSDETEYTALSFLNNSRTLERMKKELEKLGREYLFEFNDSVTLANMSNVLNKYIGQWIANRTLSYGLVEVAKNPYSDEAVDVRLNIRFNGTIEVISVDITIE